MRAIGGNIMASVMFFYTAWVGVYDNPTIQDLNPALMNFATILKIH